MAIKTKERIFTVGKGLNDVMDISYDKGIDDAMGVVGKWLIPYSHYLTPQIEEILKQLDSLKQIRIDSAKVQCHHDGKINPGHHADQPSWCDQCGEEL